MDAQKDKSAKGLEFVVREMKIEEPKESIMSSNAVEKANDNDEDETLSKSCQTQSVENKTPAPVFPMKAEVSTPSSESDKEEKVIKADVLVKQEPGQPPKLSRMASQKISTKAASLYLNYPDKTDEATSSFQVISDCIYAAKYLGATEHAFECDCAEEWDSSNNVNHACGAESDCINRATKMECIGECGCGADCQNQRFQQKSYAAVSVIQTEKKGYGLRAESDMQPHDFIFEYIGEVINELAFRRRMRQYDEEGIKHFYFMSLSKGEFVDATKKGNLGRFCNHSCNPNCYVDKWVVGDKLRMGIFASRSIKAGEELQFNYNVDRYGADPQPCYCGEPNCTGYIGGKTQTERGTKLSTLTIEALGIDDGDDWDTAIAKKPRKKKKNEDDEEYVVNVQPRALDEAGVTKVMATLRQCKEKWIAVKLLSRIQRAEEEKVRHRVVRMHGYQILNTTLSAWMEDSAVALQILDILFALPRITRNKIQDSKIEGTVEKLKDSEDEKLRSKANELLDIWSKLEVGYRIPRVKRDPNVQHSSARSDLLDRRASTRDRSRSRSRSRERSLDAPKGPSAPSGPRSNIPQKNPAMFGGRQPFRRSFHPLPAGWFAATSNGRTYYYSASGQTTWQRPTVPASQPPPPPPKVMTHEQKLQEIINSITQAATPKEKTPASASEPVEKVVQKHKKNGKSDKWRSYSEEKQKKLYENTLFPHIKYVMDRYKNKLPRDDLKRFGKEIAKKLVNSDYKNKRVQDPTRISSKQEKQVKKYVKEFFDKAVAKREQHDRKKAERRTKGSVSSLNPLPQNEDSRSELNEEEEDVKVDLENMKMEDDIGSEDEINGLMQEASPLDEALKGSESPSDLKRKRENKTPPLDQFEDIDFTTPKKIKSETDTPPPPPPPPPPPEDMQEDDPGIDGKVEPVEMNTSMIKQEQSEVDLSFKSEEIPLQANGTSDAKVFGDKFTEETRPSLRPKFDRIDGAPSPMQLVTPPISGFFDLEKTGDKAKQVNGREAVQEVTVADN